MYPGIRLTREGYRMACPRGHTDLIIQPIPNAPMLMPQIFCPHCFNRDGSIQPVCSIRQLKEFVEIFCGDDSSLYEEVLDDVTGYFGL